MLITTLCNFTPFSTCIDIFDWLFLQVSRLGSPTMATKLFPYDFFCLDFFICCLELLVTAVFLQPENILGEGEKNMHQTFTYL